MKSITVANQKGGVGKSTFAIHLALYLVEKNARVAFIDLDGQANSSGTLKNRATVVARSSQLFSAESISLPDCSEAGVYLFAATKELNDVERMKEEVVLQPAKLMQQLSDEFDYVVVDTPPTLGLRLISSLVLSEYLLCPIDLGGYSTSGIAEMISVVKRVQSNTRLNPSLKFLGMLPNLVNSRSERHRQALKDLFAAFSDYIIQKPLVNRSSVQQATDSGRAVWELTNNGAANLAAKEWRSALAQVTTMIEG